MGYYDIEESGKRMKELRLKKKMTQEQVAEKLGVNQGTYANKENGKQGAKIDNLINIAEILGCTTDYLLLGNDKEYAKSNDGNEIDKYDLQRDREECQKLVEKIMDLKKEERVLIMKMLRGI